MAIPLDESEGFHKNSDSVKSFMELETINTTKKNTI